MTDDWDTEYGPSGPNREWFEGYLGEVERVVTGPDEFRASLRETWTDEHGRPPTWVEELLLDSYAEHMEAAMDRIISDTNNWQPLGFLGASSSVPPNRVETEEQRVKRELVPLVRQAVDEPLVGVVPRLDPDLARLRAYWPQGKPFPQPPLADWANKPVTWPSIVGWHRDQERHQHDVECGCPAHSWWLP